VRTYPVIDLFAGPGGLGEGFSAFQHNGRENAFKIKLSIEKDPCAHQTLELRAFLRYFPPSKAPDDYYDYLAGRITRTTLFSKYRDAARCAKEEAWLAELGDAKTPERLVDDRIRSALGSRNRWLLIGGPPCQAYSLVGRSRVIGGEGVAKYEADPKHRLYRHYLRILAVHQPSVFVMENVKGLLSAKLKNENTIESILKDLRHPFKALPALHNIAPKTELEYRLFPLVKCKCDLFGSCRPKDYVIRAEEYGIPQARHRVIILGIRMDHTSNQLGTLDCAPTVTIDQIIGDLPHLRSGLSKEHDSPEIWQNAIRNLAKMRWMNNGTIREELRKELLRTVKRVKANLDRGKPFKKEIAIPVKYSNWFNDPRLGGVCNHEARTHIRADLHRYFFAAVYTRLYKRSPLLEDFPKELLPDHKNAQDALKTTIFNDRFRVQAKGQPSTTVVSHIAKDGHYYIHYDPTQCRSLTVREAARLQTFPDNYFFEGPRTEQYKQVGNAVPPLLAKQIAKIVYDIFQQIN